jgi:hypothetical protein
LALNNLLLMLFLDRMLLIHVQDATTVTTRYQIVPHPGPLLIGHREADPASLTSTLHYLGYCQPLLCLAQSLIDLEAG